MANEKIQIPMPEKAFRQRYGAVPGQSYSVSEFLELIEPTYQIYEKQISRCISGLTAYAAQQAAARQDEQLPMLRNLVMEMASFWNLDGGMDHAADDRMERRYGGGFDRTVSEARQSGQFPALSSQAKEDVLSGLEVHIQELSNNEGPDEWIEKSTSLARQLQSEWRMALAPSQQDTLTFMI